jgi:16S rRNA (guanine527-N7)-methyltransferase
MTGSPLLQSDLSPNLLQRYAALVRQYSMTLDLSSPEVLDHFEVAIQRTEAYSPLLQGQLRVLDIGSGVGLPGIPIAIRHSDVEITLTEVRKRRAAFLERVVSSLNLSNARVYNGDVQQLGDDSFDVVIGQAVGSLVQVYRLSQHVLKPSWTILTRKGDALNDELEELKSTVGVIRVATRPLGDGTAVVAVYGGENATDSGGDA